MAQMGLRPEDRWPEEAEIAGMSLRQMIYSGNSWSRLMVGVFEIRSSETFFIGFGAKHAVTQTSYVARPARGQQASSWGR